MKTSLGSRSQRPGLAWLPLAGGVSSSHPRNRQAKLAFFEEVGPQRANALCRMTTPSSNSVAADAAQRSARIAALLHAATELAADLQPLRFAPPVACVYQPLEYAWDPFERYVRTYGGTSREVLLLGMNPGPFGMGQTGVPFGEISMARTWLRIEAPVGRPARDRMVFCVRPTQGKLISPSD